MPHTALQGLLADLTRDFNSEAQPVDTLQYCSDWFQNKLKVERATFQSTDLPSRVGPNPTANPIRKFPNFPTMPLPQIPTNIFASHLSQPSPFSEHGPADSPFGTGSLAQRRATMAVTGSIGPMSQPSFPGHLQQSSAAAGYTLGSTAGPLGNLPEEEFIEEESQANAPSSFANFTFRQDSGKDLQNEPSLSPAPRFPPPANSSGTANTATDELRPPSYALGRRTSVSAESLMPTTLDFGLPGNSGPGSTPVDPSAPAEGSQITKTESQLQRIRESIRLNFLFRNLDEEQERDVLAAMREVSVQPGEVVIEQGATGDFFYVVESGEFDIYKKTGQADPARSPWGDKVFTTGAGGSFGELALMYNAPRNATVVAKGEATLWALDRISFRTILLDHTSRKRRMYENFLASVPILASLEAHERAKVADALESKTYQPGETIISEGEPGDEFFLVESGVAIVEKSGSGVIGELSRGDYFGELALLNRAPRAATVKASEQESSKLRLAALGEKAFTRLLGPVREIMARKAGEMYGTGGLYKS